MTRFVDGPAASPGFRLWHTTLAWQRAVTAALAPLELTHVQFVLLACTWWLADHGGPPRQVDVAAQAGTEARMTSEVLRTLEQRGLVTRVPDPEDTRARRVSPTARGRTLARRAVRTVETADAEFFGTHGERAMRLFDALTAEG